MSKELKQTGNIHIRPAQIGDVCLLLVPTRDVEINQLRQHQVILQSLFGGFLVEEFHLTCQRFKCSNEMVESLVKDLQSHLRVLHPIKLEAVGLETLFSPVQQTSILKWSINVSKALVELVTIIERKIKAAGIQPLYVVGFVSSLVTALKEVTKFEKVESDCYGELPYHLFTGGKIILSRITGVKEFDTLGTIYLGREEINDV